MALTTLDQARKPPYTLAQATQLVRGLGGPGSVQPDTGTPTPIPDIPDIQPFGPDTSPPTDTSSGNVPPYYLANPGGPSQPAPPAPGDIPTYDPFARGDHLFAPSKYHPQWMVASYDLNGKLIGLRPATTAEIPNDPNNQNPPGGPTNNYAADNAFKAQQLADAEAQQQIANQQWDQQFGQNKVVANRNELGNRASAGVSTGDLLLNLAKRNDALANDPGNFPAWLAAMQGNTALGPAVQNLVGQGVTIQPQQDQYLNSPAFKSLVDSLLGYGTVPNPGAVSDVQNAYNANPDAAKQFFSQDPANLQKMFGTPMATGGSFTTNGPMTFQDLSSGKNIATAGEAGPEKVTVTPDNAPNAGLDTSGATSNPWSDAWSAFNPGKTYGVDQGGVQYPAPAPGVSPSSGTAMALGKVLGSGGFSFVPTDIRNTLNAGNLPTPGQFPDWMLNKLPPSIRGLLTALITSKLGGTGAADYNWTRGLYEQPGFTGAGGVIR